MVTELKILNLAFRPLSDEGKSADDGVLDLDEDEEDGDGEDEKDGKEEDEEIKEISEE